mgnify:CR=1 FL=1
MYAYYENRHLQQAEQRIWNPSEDGRDWRFGNMRFLHLGDLHLGKIVNEFSMLEDQRYILEEILHIIDEKKVDGLLIAGDVYDKSIPSEEAVRLLDWFLNGMVERGVPVYMISGNHDSDERRKQYSGFPVRVHRSQVRG